MAHLRWEGPFCGSEGRCVTGTRAAFGAQSRGIKAGKADHLPGGAG
ncbi:hypothetical protein [Streptomyces klenkii]